MNVLEGIINKEKTNNTTFIKQFMLNKDTKKLHNYYYTPYSNLNINDKVYLVSKSTLLLFKYGTIVQKNNNLLNIRFNKYSLNVNKDEYHFFKEYNTYNILNDMINF